MFAQLILNISEEKLKKYGAVSEEVCKAMAINAKEKLEADWAIAISGIAGPNGGSQEKPEQGAFVKRD